MADVTPIGLVPDGGVITIQGRVEPASGEVLDSPGGKTSCVFWQVSADGGPSRSAGVPFWLEDESGRALVHPEGATLEVRSQRHEEFLSVVDADIRTVSVRLRELKDLCKEASGPAQKKLYAERRAKKKLATFLCAVGAHARGNVHVGGTLDGQADYIRDKRSDFEDGGKTRTLALLSESHEVVLAEGDEVAVTGQARVELLSPKLGGAVGYRDLASCLQLRGPGMVIRGVSAEVAPIEDSLDDEVSRALEQRPPRALVGYTPARLLVEIGLVVVVVVLVSQCIAAVDL
ncbi:MAG: hypothetical protein KJO07_19335 [Deltaproteobacteria bacterium]|nr:hypothetical protein [Deltaproteobacteria bacterium]